MIRRTQSVVLSLAMAFVIALGSVLPAFAAVSTPTNLSLVGGVYTNDTTPTFTWNSPAGATWYEFALDNGSWKSIGNVQAYTHRELPTGWHTFFLRAHNNAGDISVSTSVTFEIDTKGPDIYIANTSATEDRKTDLRVSTSSNDVVATWCEIVVNGKTYTMAAQPPSGLRRDFTFPYTFYTKGSYQLHALCKDSDGNYSSTDRNITVQAGSSTPYGDDGLGKPAINVARGTIVKTQCDSYAPKSDSCHAVYYFGHDGKRHAFTSEAVYKSWYGNSYAGLVIVSEAQLHAMPIGENVTIRPGTNLVKFSGSTTVYAVEKGAVLRPIVNEAVAKAIYGSRWASTIVSLPVTIRGDYTFGEKINSSSDYSKSQAYYSVRSIDENF